jgi:FMN reductase
MAASERMRAVAPLIVGVGGGWRQGSATEKALCVVLDAVARDGFETQCFAGEALAAFPIYRPGMPLPAGAEAFVDSVRRAVGVVIATPGYHGGISGMVKNALDMLEETSRDDRPYLEGRAVGCVVTGFGWQTCGTTLAGVRSIVHALRGWPTPLGAALNVSVDPFDGERCVDSKARGQLEAVARQVAAFARSNIAAIGAATPSEAIAS